MKKCLFLSIFLFFLFSLNLVAGSIDAGDFLTSGNSQNSEFVASTGKVYDFNAQAAHDLLAGRLDVEIENFPISVYESKNLKLERQRSIIDANTKFLVGGNDKGVSMPRMKRFSGVIEGESNSKVDLILVGDNVFCTLERPGHATVSISPLNHSKEKCIMLNGSEKFGRNYDFNCYSGEMELAIEEKMKMLEPRMLSDEMLEVEMALETDTELFKACGSDEQTAREYALAIFSMVSAIYEREINVTFYITWLKTWTESPADPYACGGNPFDLSNKARVYWADNYQDVERDAFHVMTSISYGGGGYGFFNAFCKTDGYGHSTSSVQAQHHYPTFAFTYDVYIIAHEMGHNFNAQHTHSCFFGAPLDTCVADEAISGGCLAAGTTPKPNPGSIMSYCASTNFDNGLGYQSNMYFRQENKEIMRKAAEDAECVVAAEDPSIYLMFPKKREAFAPGETIAIRWKSSRVDEVDISIIYPDGNEVLIEENVNASEELYEYQLPEEEGNKYRIIIKSSADKEINDYTSTGFAIANKQTNGLLANFYFSNNLENSAIGEYADAESVGQVTYTEDRFGTKGNAVYFEELGFLYIPNADCVFDEMTVAFWIKADQLQDKSFFVGTDYGPATNVFSTYHWGQLGWSLYRRDKLIQNWGGGVSLDNWHFIVYVYDGIQSLIYVDNTLKSQSNVGSPLIPYETAIYIGARNGKEYFHGALDDLKIYNRAISQQEINALFTETPTSVEVKIAEKQNLAMPNPFGEELKIQTTFKSIRIINLLGEVVYQKTNSARTDVNLTINTSQWLNGIYIVDIDGKIEKVIKNK